MPLNNRKRLILAKIETTYATDAVPVPATDAILAKDINFTPLEMDTESRDLIRAYFGNSEQLPAAIRGTLEVTVELSGSGALGTAPSWGRLLRGSGFAEVVTASTKVEYTPVSGGFESLSIYFNLDGTLHKLLGARGSVSFALTAKKIPTAKFKFTGLFSPVTDVAPGAVSYSAWLPPEIVNTANTTGLTIHGFAGAVMQELTLDMSVTVTHRVLVGSESVQITDRKPTGQLTLEAVSVATKDWWTLAKNATLGAISVTHGSAAGKKVKLDMPAVQLTSPNYSDMDNIAMLQMGLTVNPSSGGTGNDELKITCL